MDKQNKNKQETKNIPNISFGLKSPPTTLTTKTNTNTEIGTEQIRLFLQTQLKPKHPEIVASSALKNGRIYISLFIDKSLAINKDQKTETDLTIIKQGLKSLGLDENSLQKINFSIIPLDDESMDEQLEKTQKIIKENKINTKRQENLYQGNLSEEKMKETLLGTNSISMLFAVDAGPELNKYRERLVQKIDQMEDKEEVWKYLIGYSKELREKLPPQFEINYPEDFKQAYITFANNDSLSGEEFNEPLPINEEYEYPASPGETEKEIEEQNQEESGSGISLQDLENLNKNSEATEMVTGESTGITGAETQLATETGAGITETAQAGGIAASETEAAATGIAETAIGAEAGIAGSETAIGVASAEAGIAAGTSATAGVMSATGAGAGAATAAGATTIAGGAVGAGAATIATGEAVAAGAALETTPVGWTITIILIAIGLILLFTIFIAEFNNPYANPEEPKSGNQTEPVAPIEQIPGLSFDLSGPTQVNKGESISYKITGSYTGTSIITITDKIPQDANYISCSECNYDSNSNTATWEIKGDGTQKNFSFDLTLSTVTKDYYVTNTIIATITGENSPGNVAANQLNCDGIINPAYTLLGIDKNPNPLENFGDPNCNFDRNALYQTLQTQDPANANRWYDIARNESSYIPNTYRPHNILPQTPDPAGAWGLFQMGRGKNGQYDHGDVEWHLQTSNAINYYKTVLQPAGLDLGAYWETARN